MKKPVVIFIFVLIIIPWLISSKILFLTEPPVWPDEAVFTDIALNVMNTGVAKTELFGEAIPGLFRHALWYPPLYFYILSVWFKFFGSSIESLRILSIIFSILSLTVLFLLFRKLFKKMIFITLAFIPVLSDIYFAQASRTGRMDMVNFFIVTCGLYFISLQPDKPKLSAILTGIAGGIGILLHPYGVIVPLAFVIYVITGKSEIAQKIRMFLYAGVPLISAIILWVLFINGDFDLLLKQYALQFQLKAGEPFISINMILVYPQWFLIYIPYLIFLAIFAYFVIKRRDRDYFFWFLTTIAVLTGVLWGKEFWFMLYLQPFLAIITIIIFKELWLIKNKPALTAFLMLCSLILGMNLFYQYNAIRSSLPGNYDYHEFTEMVAKQIKPNSRVFLAAIPDPYFDLKKTNNLQFFEFPLVPVTLDDYLKLLDESDYILWNQPDLKVISDYVKINSGSVRRVKQKNGYNLLLINLVPRNKRIRI